MLVHTPFGIVFGVIFIEAITTLKEYRKFISHWLYYTIDYSRCQG